MTYTIKEMDKIKAKYEAMLLGKIEPESALLYFQEQRNRLIGDKSWRKDKPYLINSQSGLKTLEECKQIERDAGQIDYYIKSANDLMAIKSTSHNTEFDDIFFICDCKEKSPDKAYLWLKALHKAEIIKIIDGKIDFPWKQWQIKRFFIEAGRADWKDIIPYVLCKGEKCKYLATVRQQGSSTESEWENIKKTIETNL